MSVCWGIVIEEPDRIDRWLGVVAAGLTGRLVVPLTDGSGVLITRGSLEPIVERVDVAEVLAEEKLLVCDDVLHRDVDQRFDGFSVFLPDPGAPRPLPSAGFEPNAYACGVVRLLPLDGFAAFDLQLRAAARLARRRRLAIEFNY